MTTRQRLPNRRASETFAFELGALTYIATVGFFPSGSSARSSSATEKLVRKPTPTRAMRRSRLRSPSNTVRIWKFSGALLPARVTAPQRAH